MTLPTLPTPDNDIGSGQHVQMVRIERIRILNPRVRDRRHFEEIVDNIAKIGLKRPITVSRRKGPDPGGAEFDLVCGQGRLEAFVELGQTEIPAIVIDADEPDCLVMSLVENCARRQHRAVDLLQEVGTLRKRGYDDTQIATKIGVTSTWVGMIAGLIEKGEARLLAAVEAGTLPISLAVEIAKADDDGVQRALTQAYTEKKLKGRKLVAVRRLIEQRQRRGKHIYENRFGQRNGARRPATSEAMVRIYRQEVDRQKLLIRKAEVTSSRLLFAVEALRSLRTDDHFVTLLRAEGLSTMPAFLEERLHERAHA